MGDGFTLNRPKQLSRVIGFFEGMINKSGGMIAVLKMATVQEKQIHFYWRYAYI